MSTDPFDALRGRARPAPGAVPEPDAVVTAGRRRRRRAVVSGGAGSTLLAGVLAITLLTGSSPDQSLRVVDDPTPTSSESPVGGRSPGTGGTTTPDPSGATGGAGATSTAGAAPTPSPSYDVSKTWDDGKPGWFDEQRGACVLADSLEERPAEPGLRLETLLPRSAWRPGERVSAYAVVTNTSSAEVTLELSRPGDRGWLLDPTGRAVSALHYELGPTPGHSLQLDPGESRRVVVSARSTACGDGPEDPDTLLAPGAYSAVFDLGDAGRTAPASMRLDPAASQREVWQMQPRGVPHPAGRPCEDNPTSQAVQFGFSLDVEAEAATVASGGTLSATIVVTSTGESRLPTDPSLSPVYVDGVTPADSTGFGSTSDPVPSYSRPTDHYDDVPTLRAGDSMRYPVLWVARSCPAPGTQAGTALAPGEYDVRFGLTVHDGEGERAFWFAPQPVRVTVTT